MTDVYMQHFLQRYSSEILWHFVGRTHRDNSQKCFEVLLSILREGTLRLSREPEPFIYHRRDGEREDLEGYPVCCLADIPLKDLLLHSLRYGEFAIGFHRKSAIRNNFMPVLYVPQKSMIIDYYLELRSAIESYLPTVSQDMAEKFDEFLLLLGSVAKPCTFEDVADDPARDSLHLNNFYYEREWRAIKEWNFSPEDVAMIIVQKPGMVDFLHDQIDSNDLKVQKSIPILSFDMVFKI